MIRRPPRSTLSSSSAASDVYKRQVLKQLIIGRAVISAHAIIRLELTALPGASKPDIRSSARGAFPVPVSYTHLRAHETPEHLVCRLLLEKKKKKIKPKPRK
eukprot:TRINITY_DN4068_c0_g1_i1.p1 TRINITY_DN4068_c0_g1~~TRINITY_DN4068_c0_g1_i1.p1  ORF type:complete len:102 (+),score=17.97 TRINITY_DN4068_c0_g1_i1:118-423(+)